MCGFYCTHTYKKKSIHYQNYMHGETNKNVHTQGPREKARKCFIPRWAKPTLLFLFILLNCFTYTPIIIGSNIKLAGNL